METLILFVLGLAFGSFVNALVWRMRQHELEEKESRAKHFLKKLLTLDFGSSGNDRYSMLTGRSMCTHCKRELAAHDLVPVLSWLWLRGKCRYCKKPIGVQYPLVELAVAVLFAVSYLFWPQPLDAWYQWFNLAVWLVGLVGLAALFVYDLRWFLLPDKITLPLIALAAVNVAVQFFAWQPQGNGFETLQFYAYGLLPVAGLYYFIHLFSKGKMVGFGDVKLGIFIGLSLGWPGALLVLFLANTIGALTVLPGMLTGTLTRTSRVPFGPFLIIAYVIAGLWSVPLIDWYMSGFGLYY